MSETIQSISNGTYTIGQTSATTYQAGPGISITQPSEGTVRISNDETVLYKSTANPATAVMPITLAEPISNFERIRIVGRNEGSTSNVIPYKVWEYDTDSLAFSTIICLDQIMPNNPISNWDAGIYCRVCCVDLSESGKIKPIHTDSYTITKAGAWSRQTTDGWGETRIYKVIGINRISGGNA